MKTKFSVSKLFPIPLTAALLGAGLAYSVSAGTLSTDGKLPLGTASKPGFRWFSYQVGPLAGGLTTQNENSEGALIGLFGGTTVGTNRANLTAAGSQGYFDIRGVINFNGDAGDIGSFTGDTPIPGIPGVTFSGDNVAAECLTYVEFTAPGDYTMGVNSDDGFRVTEGLARPRQAMIVNAPPAIAGPVGCSLPAAFYSAPAGGFGGPLPSTPITVEVVLADPILAGGPLVNAAAVSGKICIVDRGGGVAFAVKAQNAQDAGALAVIVVNENNPTQMPIGMGGSNSLVTIPAVMIGKPDGDRIKGALASGPVTMSLGALGGVELGTFNGGRGAADTTFTFTVPAAGLYPLRMLWYQGGGGKNVEWFTVDGVGGKHLLNNAADSASLRTFQGPLVPTWVAFNDHAPSASTATNVSPYNMRGWVLATDPGTAFPLLGPLTNFTASLEYPAGSPLRAEYEASTRTRSPDLFPNATLGLPDAGTPAYNLFLPGGVPIVDMANAGSSIGVGNIPADQVLGADTVVLTFRNLNPTMLYNFRGTAVRQGTVFGANHPGRWTYCAIEGADTFTDAHTAGCLTWKTPLPAFTRTSDGRVFPPLALTPGQVVFQSGLNTQGDMVGYDEINPGPDGSFSIVARGWGGVVTNLYQNMPPAGGPTITNAWDNLGYALTAIRVEEVGLLAPVWVTGGPEGTNALQNLPFTLSVRFAGTAPRFQWYKEGVGLIAGATGPSYAVASARLEDAGNYYVVLSNSFSTFTSAVAQVTVVNDITPPVLLGMECDLQTVPLSRVTIFFDERMDTTSTIDSANYVFDGNSFPGSGTMSADTKSVTFVVPAYLPGSVHTLEIIGVYDLSGNNSLITNMTWVACPLNRGVAKREWWFNLSGPNNLSTLYASPGWPNNPNQTDYIQSLNSPQTAPDVGNYGLRFTGYLFPPATGNYQFQVYADDSGYFALGTDADPGTPVMLIEANGDCGACGSPQSAVVHLTAGVAYRFDARMQEGGGGDYLNVYWKNDVSMPTYQNITGCFLGAFANPIPGVSLTVAGPADAAVQRGEQANFTVAPTAVGVTNPPVYLWQRSTDNGATWHDLTACGAGATYTTPSLMPADNNSLFRCVVGVPGLQTTSRAALLTVLPDTTRPTLVAIECDLTNFSSVTFVYSEPMDASATDQANYLYDGISFAGGGTLSGDGSSVTFAVAPYLPSSAHAIEINTVYDIEQNGLVTNLTWQACPVNRGFVKFRAYDTSSTPGAAPITLLTSHPNYPNNPRDTYYITSMNSRMAYPDDSHEQYGARMEGVFLPSVSGNYVFQTRGDDANQLWFNPAGSDPAGMILATQETGCCGAWEAHQTAPYPLVAGRAYAIMMLYKEGGGGDYGAVAVRLQSAPALTGTDLNLAIPGCQLGVVANAPRGTRVTVAGPADASAPVFTPATFTVAPTVTVSTNPPAYTWQRSTNAGATWQDVAGCVGATYTTPQLTLADDGTFIRCVVSVPGLNTASRAARITIVPNPALLSASTRGNCREVVAIFNKPMNTNGTYTVTNGITVTGIAGYGRNSNEVRLAVTPNFTADTVSYRLTVTGATAADGLSMIPNPGSATFVHGGEYPGTVTRTAPNGCVFRTLCDVFIATPPTNASAIEGFTATFSVAADGTPAATTCYFYQWSRNGTPIPGANAATYVTPPLAGTNNGDVYTCLVRNDFSSASASATLTVLPTLIVMSAETRHDPNNIYVTWNRPVMLTGTYEITAGGNFVVNGWTHDPGNSNIVIVNVETMPLNTPIDLTITGETDRIGAPQVPNPTVRRFTHIQYGMGALLFEYYPGGSGTSVATLRADPNFPNSPAARYYLPRFDTRAVFPDNSHEQYGGRISGLYYPPVTGNYVFYMSSDDASELWFNPNGEDEAGKVLIAQEPGCCHSFATIFSTNIYLVAGRGYYIEGLYREGGGGDYMQVCAQLAGLPPPTDATTQTIQATNLAARLDVIANASVSISQQPANACRVLQGTWACWDKVPCDPYNGPYASALATPPIVVPSDGAVSLEFSHRYSFEGGGWDGGIVMVSVNGGASSVVPPASFTANPYNGVISGSTIFGNMFRGPAFVDDSPGYGGPTYIVSKAGLGNFNAGDIIVVGFLASWDDGCGASIPNWEIDRLAVSMGGATSPQRILFGPDLMSGDGGLSATNFPNATSGRMPPYPWTWNGAVGPTFQVTASGLAYGIAQEPGYQWQRDNGAGFVNIPGANASSYMPVGVNFTDNGARFRCVVFFPGVSATSAPAVLTTIAGCSSLAVAHTPTNTVVLTWSSVTWDPGQYCVLQGTTNLPAGAAPIPWMTVQPADPDVISLTPGRAVMRTNTRYKFFRTASPLICP